MHVYTHRPRCAEWQGSRVQGILAAKRKRSRRIYFGIARKSTLVLLYIQNPGERVGKMENIEIYGKYGEKPFVLCLSAPP
jgi:hypothetical protein